MKKGHKNTLVFTWWSVELWHNDETTCFTSPKLKSYTPRILWLSVWDSIPEYFHRYISLGYNYCKPLMSTTLTNVTRSTRQRFTVIDYSTEYLCGNLGANSSLSSLGRKNLIMCIWPLNMYAKQISDTSS